MRARIAALEGRCTSPASPNPAARTPDAAQTPLWTLGAPEIDRRLAGGLDVAALHEVKSEGRACAAGDWAAALGFALRLAVRRLKALAARPAAAPVRIRVIAEVPEGPPARFTWRRVEHRVARAQGPERIAPEWWREIGGRTSHTRDYYRLEDEGGAGYWVFRAGLYGAEEEPRWFLHGLFG